MGTFVEIMIYAAGVLGLIAVLAGVLVFLGMWLGVTEEDGHAH